MYYSRDIWFRALRFPLDATDAQGKPVVTTCCTIAPEAAVDRFVIEYAETYDSRYDLIVMGLRFRDTYTGWTFEYAWDARVLGWVGLDVPTKTCICHWAADSKIVATALLMFTPALRWGPETP